MGGDSKGIPLINSRTLIGGKLFSAMCSFSLFRILALYISTSLRSSVCRNSVLFLEFGFPIGFTGKFNKSANKGKTHKRVSEYPLEVRKYLEKEMSYKAVLGPFSENPFSNECCISPLYTVRKKDV